MNRLCNNSLSLKGKNKAEKVLNAGRLKMELFIKKEKYHRGNDSEFYTAKARYNDINFNITYDCRTENIIVHEWYKFNNIQLSDINERIKLYFKSKTEK